MVCMNVNFAERAHNHNWKLDPIVRSLLDTDFYKLLMLQFIWKNFPAVHVTSEIVNRTARVRLAGEVDAPALIAQMEHLRSLRFRRSELIWLAGNTFYGTRQIFAPDIPRLARRRLSPLRLHRLRAGRPAHSRASPASGPK